MVIDPVIRRRLPRAQRERQLVDVAQAVFAQRGFREASMDEIAVRAGVSKPILYDHFGSKDGLVAACIRRVGADLFAAITIAVEAAEDDPNAALAAGLRGFFEFIETNGQGWYVLIGESVLVGEAADALEAIRRDQAAFVAQTLARRFPGTPAHSLAVFAEAIIGACERVALWRRERPEVTVAQATASLMTLVWNGLASMAGP